MRHAHGNFLFWLCCMPANRWSIENIAFKFSFLPLTEEKLQEKRLGLNSETCPNGNWCGRNFLEKDYADQVT